MAEQLPLIVPSRNSCAVCDRTIGMARTICVRCEHGHSFRWRNRQVPAMACEECGHTITTARAEVRADEIRFVCPDHPLPTDMAHPARYGVDAIALELEASR